MRALLTATILFIATTAFADEPTQGQGQRTGDDVDSRSLTAEQVERYTASYYPMIRACYLKHGRGASGATGELSLKLVVHRGGNIHEATVEATGVTGKRLRKLQACIRMQVVTWHFPVRPDFPSP